MVFLGVYVESNPASFVERRGILCEGFTTETGDSGLARWPGWWFDPEISLAAENANFYRFACASASKIHRKF